jgi:alkylation response protein AidB-like acyl-CoA dehydrogenase
VNKTHATAQPAEKGRLAPGPADRLAEANSSEGACPRFSPFSTLEYRLSGQKHFGSGSGVLDVMVTTAVPEGETAPDWFYLDMRGVPLDGSAGAKLIAAWDGHGMAATQSHAVEFRDFPATRIAWRGHLTDVAARAGGFIGCLFTSVIVGIVEVAVETAHGRLKPPLGAYEQVEWTRVQVEAWLIAQAYEGMLRAIEQQDDPRLDVLKGKTAIAELSETVLTRLCRILGGGTYSRRSPFGHWFEDVRALGFLRPPWGLAHETLIQGLSPTKTAE